MPHSHMRVRAVQRGEESSDIIFKLLGLKSGFIFAPVY